MFATDGGRSTMIWQKQCTGNQFWRNERRQWRLSLQQIVCLEFHHLL